MNTQLISAFLMSFVLSLGLTPLVRKLAFKIGALDHPNHRKAHAQPTPRIGGLAITAAFVVTMLANTRLDRPLVGLLAGVGILLLGGLLDDVKGLSARSKLVWQIVAAIVVLAGGIGIVYFSNPLGGTIQLDNWRIPAEIFGFKFNIIPLANFVSVLWMLGMINAVNFLDGLDGLAAGVAAIAGIVLFVFAVSSGTGHPVVALLSLILVGALLGFLPYNFFPSRIFMGDSGAYVVGLLLALLSIYSGSKIAVGALVLGFAVIDMVWVALRRLSKRQHPFKADRLHLHHRLLDSGLFSHRRVVVILYFMTIAVAVTIFLAGGVAAFVLLLLLLIAVVSLLRILKPIPSRRL